MTAELLLLRHGKTDWEAELDDYYRPLVEQGRRGAQRIGVWLAQQGLLPDHVVSSPAERALDAADNCCKSMGMDPRLIHREPRVYVADQSMLLKILAECPAGAKRVMLVGHNPGMEQLLTWLAEKGTSLPEDGKILSTASLARLVVHGTWDRLGQGSASLESITRASSLPKKFPFPLPESEERRNRPAFYFTQSSVIPWRLKEGKMQILVISSRSKKHWIVPKGIWEPGLTAQESAAKEALEEAGVEGLVAEKAIGTYHYPKWGGTCSVEVYPMEVTQVLAEKDWQESYRGREWVSLGEAMNRLNQDELKPMLQRLASLLNVK